MSIEVNEEDGDAVAEHIAKLASLQGYTSRLMASCEYNFWMDKKNVELRAMYTLSERLNSAAGKSILAYQSVLGKLKMDRQMAPFGS